MIFLFFGRLKPCHAPPYAGHRGILATTQALERCFFWPNIHKDIEAYVREYMVCQKVKFDRHKAPGLLQPLPIPNEPWESITMDFIMDLPRTPQGNDDIWTIIVTGLASRHISFPCTRQ